MKILKKALIIILVMSVILSFCACTGACLHSWQEATCTLPRTCSLCGATEGDAAGHSYGDTTCISQEPCTVCGTYEGIVPTHKWREDGKVCLLCGQDKRNTDEKFMDALVEGLEEGWSFVRQDENPMKVAKEDWERSFYAEYDRLTEFKDADFKNEELGEAAKSYITSLVEVKKALDVFGTYDWYVQYTNWAYHDRTLALYKINEISPIDVDGKYKRDITMMLENGRTINEINAMCAEIDFHNISSVDETPRYEAMATNTTALDFQKFSIELAFTDEKGETIATKTLTVRNWKAGQEKLLKFTTKEDFKKIELKYVNWTLAM